MPNPADTALAFARQQIGKPYQWGATGPNSFDCSGLIMRAYESAGIHLPRTSAMMLTAGTLVSQSALAAGDLLWPHPGHVMLFSGNGMVVEAAHSGTPVREVPTRGYWTARRVTAPGTAGGGSTTPGSTTGGSTTGGSSGPSVLGIGIPGLGALEDLKAQIQSIFNTFAEIGKVLTIAAKPETSIRFGEMLLGIVLLLTGLKRLSGGIG